MPVDIDSRMRPISLIMLLRLLTTVFVASERRPVSSLERISGTGLVRSPTASFSIRSVHTFTEEPIFLPRQTEMNAETTHATIRRITVITIARDVESIKSPTGA